MKLILQITLGVSLGILLGGTMLIFVAGSPSTQLLSDILKQPSGHSLLKLPAIPELPTSTIVQPSIQPASSPVDTKTAAEIEEQARQQQLQLADQEEKRKKDEAFKIWYHKPVECLTPNDHGHDVKIACGNDHIRARAKFEELYQQEKLKN